MFHFYASPKYELIHTERDYGADAPAICARLEKERGDGFAVWARDGSSRLVADAEGWIGRRGVPGDAATATGMYDGL